MQLIHLTLEIFNIVILANNCKAIMKKYASSILFLIISAFLIVPTSAYAAKRYRKYIIPETPNSKISRTKGIGVQIKDLSNIKYTTLTKDITADIRFNIDDSYPSFITTSTQTAKLAQSKISPQILASSLTGRDADGRGKKSSSFDSKSSGNAMNANSKSSTDTSTKAKTQQARAKNDSTETQGNPNLPPQFVEKAVKVGTHLTGMPETNIRNVITGITDTNGSKTPMSDIIINSTETLGILSNSKTQNKVPGQKDEIVTLHQSTSQGIKMFMGNKDTNFKESMQNAEKGFNSIKNELMNLNKNTTTETNSNSSE